MFHVLATFSSQLCLCDVSAVNIDTTGTYMTPVIFLLWLFFWFHWLRCSNPSPTRPQTRSHLSILAGIFPAERRGALFRAATSPWRLTDGCDWPWITVALHRAAKAKMWAVIIQCCNMLISNGDETNCLWNWIFTCSFGSGPPVTDRLRTKSVWRRVGAAIRRKQLRIGHLYPFFGSRMFPLVSQLRDTCACLFACMTLRLWH